MQLQYKFQIKYLPGKRNSAADLLLRYPALCALSNTTDEKQTSDMEVALVAATVAALDSSYYIVADSMAVAQAAAEDPDYLLTKVTTGDWHPHRVQELACLHVLQGQGQVGSVPRTGDVYL